MRSAFGQQARRYGAILLALTTLAVAPTALSGCSRTGDPAGGGATASQRSHDPADVLGKLWLWEATVTPVEKIEVPNPESYNFELLPEGKLAAKLDCNRGMGTYQIAEGKLTFGPIASTKMACPPGSLADRYARDLGQVTSFFVEDGKLFLELPVDSGTLRFREAKR